MQITGWTRRRVVLLCTSALTCWAWFAPASAQQAIVTPILTSDPNFRDLAGIITSAGGNGFADVTANGGAMRTGVFYRSESLSILSAPDWTTLSSLHIGLDIDLRTPWEINSPASVSEPNNGQDWVPSGARYLNVNIYGTSAPPPNTVATVADAITYMKGLYQGFVQDPVQRSAFRTVLLTLANEDAAALYHCSAGKDRTGWTSMLLQSIAGVSYEKIKNSYLASNTYMASSIQTILNQIQASQGLAARLIAEPILAVDESYLKAGLDQVVAQYGSIYGYLTQGLGLTLADIYVLRGKMVYFATLPGQAAMVGNSASGAALLNALQNSPLSGHYTAFNYYLQSAVDAGTLGGVEARAGGQVHADTGAFLARQSLWVDAALATHVDGRDLRAGESRAWFAGVGGYFNSRERAGVASSTERSGGPLAGTTWRIDAQSSAFVGVGYNSGSVSSAGGNADLNTGLAAFGGRYALSSLDHGLYVAARAQLGYVDDATSRSLGFGLGSARGHTDGGVFGARADLGNVVRLAPWTLTPQLGLRATYVRLGRFGETGSDLALAVEPIRYTQTSAVADLDVALDPRGISGWQVAPSLSLGYERALANPRAESTASLYGYTVGQSSAYDSRNLFKAGFALAARQDAAIVKAGVNAILGDHSSAGFDARVSFDYQF